MDISERLDELIKFIYDISQDSSLYGPKYGVSAETIITRYNERYNNLENISTDDIRLLIEKGLLEEAPAINPNDRPILSGRTRLKITALGIEHVEQGRKKGQAIIKAAPTIAELIGRFFKGLFGK